MTPGPSLDRVPYARTWWARLRHWLALRLAWDLGEGTLEAIVLAHASRALQAAKASEIASIVEEIARRGVVWDVPESAAAGVRVQLAMDHAKNACAVQVREPLIEAEPPEAALIAAATSNLVQKIRAAHAREIAELHATHDRVVARLKSGGRVSKYAGTNGGE